MKGKHIKLFEEFLNEKHSYEVDDIKDIDKISGNKKSGELEITLHDESTFVVLYELIRGDYEIAFESGDDGTEEFWDENWEDITDMVNDNAHAIF